MQFAACSAYALALRHAQVDGADPVSRLVRAWVEVSDRPLRQLLFEGSPPAAAAPCWRCHLLAFCVVSVALFCTLTFSNWWTWAGSIDAALRRRGLSRIQIKTVVGLRRWFVALGAFASASLILFPAAAIAGDWYFVVAPAAAAATSYLLACSVVLRRVAQWHPAS
jgi:hypothetical protein